MPYIQFFGASGSSGPPPSPPESLLQASNGSPNDNFGTSVALSSDGRYAIITAPNEDTAANNAGSLYTFYRWGPWSEQQILQASDAAANDTMGYTSFGTPIIYPAFTIALSDDGSRAVVGVGMDNGTDGAAYVFTRSGITWTQEAKIPGAVGAGDNFGFCVAMDAAGEYIAIGAPRRAASGGTDAGVVYVFTRSGTTWTEQQQISMTSGGGATDSLGLSVAISGDASTIIAGRPFVTKAEVFTRSGTTWTREAGLIAGDANGSGYFGTSVAISTDGNTVAVGSRIHTTAVGTLRGAVYVFARSAGIWTQAAKLYDVSGSVGDEYATTVAMSGDADRILIGAPEKNVTGTSSGGSFLHRGYGTWALETTLIGADTTANDHFGNAVALSRDGLWALIGAFTDTNSGGSSAGSAYAFGLDP